MNKSQITLCMVFLIFGMLSGNSPAEVTLVSASVEGVPGSEESEFSGISADGALVVFSTSSDNLVPGEQNTGSHVFVKNVMTGSIQRVSVDAGGVLSNAGAHAPSISASGLFTTFTSSATNLIPDDTNNAADVFVKSIELGQIVRVSENAAGGQANGDSDGSKISADGRLVTFSSSASNLVQGDTNEQLDVFVKNIETGNIVLVSGDAAGVLGNANSYAPSISADGRFVVFFSNASNFVAGDTNDQSDVFVKNVMTGEILRVSTDAGGAQANGGSYQPDISADGRFIVFESTADNLIDRVTEDNRQEFVTDVFVKDMNTDGILRVSENAWGVQATGNSSYSSISADGRYVAFESDANNLVSNDNCQIDVFVKDMSTGKIVRVSQSLENMEQGVQANNVSGLPNISADGRFVAFSSDASNLVLDDNNGRADVFRADVIWPAAAASPLNLRHAVYSDRVAEMFWDRIFHSGSVQYEITRNGELVGVFDTLSITEYELLPSVQYSYTVTAIDENGVRLATDNMSVSTNCIDLNIKPRNPSTPRNLNFAIYSDTDVEVFWSRSSDDGSISGYEITRNGLFDGVTNAQSVFYKDHVPGVIYTYTITAIDDEGRRSTTSSIQLTTGRGQPDPIPQPDSSPTAPNLQSAVYSKNSAELFWERSTDNTLVIGYEVIRNGKSRGILDVLSVYDDDLIRGVSYFYEITAVDANQNRSTTSRIRVTTGDTQIQGDDPAPPTGLRVVRYSSGSAELFWDRSNILGLHYEIERDGAVLATNDGTSYYDNTLARDVRFYEYSVATIDADDRRSTATTITLGMAPAYRVK